MSGRRGALPVVLGVILAGCGTGAGTTTSEPVTTITPPTTTEAPAGFLSDREVLTVRNAGKAHLLATLHLSDGVDPISQCSVDFGPAGDQLAAACGMDSAVIWDLATGEEIRSLDHGATVVGVGFSAAGDLVATGGFDGVVRLWDLATGAESAALEVHDARVWDVEFRPDGRFLGSIAFEDGDVVVWDLSGETPVANEFPMIGRGLSLALDPRGGDLATGWIGGEVRLVSLVDGEVQWQTTEPFGNVGDVAFSPDGRMLAAGSDDNRAWIWDASVDGPGVSLAGHDGYVNGVAFSPDGTLLVTGSHDGTVGIWDTATRDRLAKLEGHEDPVLRVAMNPGGDLIASISWDGTIRLWGVAAA